MRESVRRYHTAKGYFQSCVMIERSPERNTDARRTLTVLSMMMLIGFSLELYFKSWLLAKGVPSNQVQSFKHRIGDLYSTCQEHGLTLDQLDALVETVGPQHQNLTYRYIENNVEVPILNWALAFQVLDDLDELVDRIVGASAFYGLQPGR